MKKKLTNKQILAYPTESFYALGVNATNEEAVRRLFKLKHREKNKPIALIAADLKQVKKFFYMTKGEERLAKKFWPSALTILLKPKTPSSPGATPPRAGVVGIAAGAAFLSPPSHKEGSGGGQQQRPRHSLRIGVRVPSHRVARKLAAAVGAPITATSANISGQPPTKSARKIKKLFPDIMIVPGRCGKSRQPSTIIEMKNSKINIIRQGATYV